jgi:hypothetical protein
MPIQIADCQNVEKMTKMSTFDHLTPSVSLPQALEKNQRSVS